MQFNPATGTRKIDPATEVRTHMGAIRRQFTVAELFPALRKARDICFAGIHENFDTESSSINGPWPPRKDDLPHPILQETGALRKAATGQGPGHITSWENDGFIIGVDTGVNLGGIPAAQIHNEGGSRMPQREFITPGRTYLDDAEDVIADWITDKLAEESGG